MKKLVGPVDHGEASYANSIHRVLPIANPRVLVILSGGTGVALVVGHGSAKASRLARMGGFIPIMGSRGIGAGIHPRYPH
jgi:hypothetical protein